MPTKNPRIHVVLEKPLFHDLRNLAKKNGLSVSLEARDLIRESMKSSGRTTHHKVYTGKHFKKLIGKYRAGKFNAGDVLAEQAHG